MMEVVISSSDDIGIDECRNLFGEYFIPSIFVLYANENGRILKSKVDELNKVIRLLVESESDALNSSEEISSAESKHKKLSDYYLRCMELKSSEAELLIRVVEAAKLYNTLFEALAVSEIGSKFLNHKKNFKELVGGALKSGMTPIQINTHLAEGFERFEGKIAKVEKKLLSKGLNFNSNISSSGFKIYDELKKVSADLVEDFNLIDTTFKIHPLGFEEFSYRNFKVVKKAYCKLLKAEGKNAESRDVLLERARFLQMVLISEGITGKKTVNKVRSNMLRAFDKKQSKIFSESSSINVVG